MKEEKSGCYWTTTEFDEDNYYTPNLNYDVSEEEREYLKGLPALFGEDLPVNSKLDFRSVPLTEEQTKKLWERFEELSKEK